MALNLEPRDTVGLRGRDFLSLHDFTPAEVCAVLELADRFRVLGVVPEPGHELRLAGRAVGLVFLKPSTRTRVAFEVAAAQLGAHPVVMRDSELQLSRGETLEDTARVLARMLAAIVVRGHAHADLVRLAAASAVPVINALSDLLHPSQAVADLLTLRARFGRLRGLTLAYVGDGNNMAHSLLFAAAKTGLRLRVATPPGFGPDPEIVALARQDAAETGGVVELGQDPREAVRGADAVYTDVWVSMGQEAEALARRQALAPYRVDARLFALASPQAVFLHCLPAHRGEEVDAAVIDGSCSLVLEQAGNRLFAAKAILTAVV